MKISFFFIGKTQTNDANEINHLTVRWHPGNISTPLTILSCYDQYVMILQQEDYKKTIIGVKDHD